MSVSILCESSHQENLLACGAEQVVQLLKALGGEQPIVLGVCGGRSIIAFLKAFTIASRKVPNLLRRLQFFLVDERMVPLDSPESNFQLLQNEFFAELLAQKEIHSSQIHPFIPKPDFADFGIHDYEREFQSFGGYFHVIFLSAGEDGHVASLFPNHPSIKESHPGFIYVTDSPKPPSERMSASRDLLRRSTVAALLVLGASKQNAWEMVNDSSRALNECPAKLIHACRDAVILTDRE